MVIHRPLHHFPALAAGQVLVRVITAHHRRPRSHCRSLPRWRRARLRRVRRKGPSGRESRPGAGGGRHGFPIPPGSPACGHGGRRFQGNGGRRLAPRWPRLSVRSGSALAPPRPPCVQRPGRRAGGGPAPRGRRSGKWRTACSVSALIVMDGRCWAIADISSARTGRSNAAAGDSWSKGTIRAIGCVHAAGELSAADSSGSAIWGRRSLASDPLTASTGTRRPASSAPRHMRSAFSARQAYRTPQRRGTGLGTVMPPAMTRSSGVSAVSLRPCSGSRLPPDFASTARR